MRQVLLYPGEDGWWVAEVPSLSGTISQGRTREEAIENIKDAIELMIETLQESGQPVPTDPLERHLVLI